MRTTLDELQARLAPANRGGGEYPALLSKLKCADGLELSVQASRGHYCIPRDSVGPWHDVEVGFPTMAIAELLPYAEDPEKPTETVYGYVPLTLVVEVIDRHGGLADAPAPGAA